MPVRQRGYLSESGSADWSVADTRDRKEWKSSSLHSKDLKCIETDVDVTSLAEHTRCFGSESSCNSSRIVYMGRTGASPGFGCAEDLLGDSMFVAVGSDI